jgi:glycosyltransferase involved in cell wall biosynthesis
MISVLLPYRNAGATLEEAVASILEDMGADDELVLVDDGSSDASATIARSFADRDVRVVTISPSGTGIGIARALGRGLAACRGEWIARMDADDVSLPGRLAAERAMLESDPKLGVVATQVDLIGAAGPGIQRYVDWQNSIITAADHAREIFVEAPVCHPSTMIRRSALDAAGGFRAGPFAEDYDLWLRLDAAGWAIAKVPRVLFRWRMHDRNTTFTDPRLSFDALRRLRAQHLAKRIDRPFAIWGAGAAGRRLARELEAHEARASFFIDIDPRKIGRTRRGVPILAVDDALARVRTEGKLVVVAVAVYGARDLVRERLGADGFIEGRDFVCAA